MSFIWVNGEFVPADEKHISHRDAGFTTAIGVFDSMLAKDGEPVDGPAHYARLCYDAQIVVNRAPTYKENQYLSICRDLLARNDLTLGYARIRTSFTGGIVDKPLEAPTAPNLLIDVEAAAAPQLATLVDCHIIIDYPRIAGCVLENCKRIDYSRSYAARRKAQSLGAEEAILINTNGNIACGATSNLFIEENGVLITPPLSEGVLAGITRKRVLADTQGREEIISITRLMNADAVYLTNSFVGLRPVRSVNGKLY